MSKIDAVRLAEIELGASIFGKVLSIRVFEVLLILVGWTICGRNICEESESRNSFVGACSSYFKRSTLTSRISKTDLFSSEILSSKILE